MRKLLFSGFVLIIIMCTSFQQAQFINYTNGQKHFEFNSANGILTGHFIAYYENGNKMIEGNFNNNQKTGDWNVWNENGAHVAARSYKNNFCYTEGEFPLQNTTPKENNFLLPGTVLQPISDLNPKDILFQKEIWRTIENSNLNTLLFRDQAILEAIIQALNAGQITAYTNDDLNVPMSASQVGALNVTAINALHIKEVFLFDARRKTGEYRILAIAPAGEIGGKEDAVCWLNYAQIREILSSVPLKNSALPSFIQNAEQVFFYRYFGSRIYKESNIYNRALADYCKPEHLDEESIKIELSLIESECRLWSRTNE